MDRLIVIWCYSDIRASQNITTINPIGGIYCSYMHRRMSCMFRTHHRCYVLSLDTNQNKTTTINPIGDKDAHIKGYLCWVSCVQGTTLIRDVVSGLLSCNGWRTNEVYFTQHVWNHIYIWTYQSTISLKLSFMSISVHHRIFSPRSTSCLRWSVGRSMVSSWFPWTSW